MKALFAFTIGPVKAFIENSRKMIDLRGGSSILSILTGKAIVYIKKLDYDVIFPVIRENEEESNNKDILEFNIPNRFIATIDNFNMDNLAYYKQVARDLTEAVKNDFREMYTSTFISVDIKDEKHLSILSKQMEDFLEVHWLYQEYSDDDKESYKEAYNKVFNGLQAVKNIRPFFQSDEFWGRKCALFPEYNAIVVKKDARGNFPTHTNINDIANYIDVTESKKLEYMVKPKEALSAIALFKRAFTKDNKVKSLRCMLFEVYYGAYYEKTKDYDDYIKSPNPTYIADAIYDFYYNNNPTEEEYPKESIALANKIYKHINKNNVSLSSYYACVKFDGDSMGDVYKRISSKSEHQELSKKICDFATLAKNIIEDECRGLCVYAGGEDVLAFFPIHTLFTGLQRLHEAFYEKTKLTFSAGIAIAHLMQPLKEVLITAGKMEHHAKSIDQKSNTNEHRKNAFALSLIKRSGELRTIRHKFYLSNEKDYEVMKIMDEIVKSLSKEEYSKSLAHDITKTLSSINNDVFCSDMLQIIIKQVFMQKRIVNPELLNKFYKLLSNCKCLQDYVDFLDISRFLSREVFDNVSNQSS